MLAFRRGLRLVSLRFKEGVEHQKMEDANSISRLARKFNLAVSGTQESISLSGVPMKAQELCDILNERLIIDNADLLIASAETYSHV